jgi:ABC-type sulfate transport system substrate-binding protein
VFDESGKSFSLSQCHSKPKKAAVDQKLYICAFTLSKYQKGKQKERELMTDAISKVEVIELAGRRHTTTHSPWRSFVSKAGILSKDMSD